MSIDQQLREAISKSGKTRYAIAKGAGIDHAILRRYLNERRDLRLSNVEKLAAYFGMRLTTPKRPK